MTFSKNSLLLILPVFAACSQEPSEKNLQQAYQDSLNQTNQMTKRIGGDAMAIKLNEFKKLSCDQPNEQKHYHCNIQATLELPLLGPNTQTGEITVVKADKEWVVLEH